MNETLLKFLNDLLALEQFCHETQISFTEQNNCFGEELYSYLRYKVIFMYELIDMCIVKEMMFPGRLVEVHGFDIKEIPYIQSQMFEIQQLIFPRYVSLVESMFRKAIQAREGHDRDILMNEAIHYLENKKIISHAKAHLLHGIRHMRNAETHYDSISKVTDIYIYADDLVVSLKTGKPIQHNDLFQPFAIMRWLAYTVKPVFAKLKSV